MSNNYTRVQFRLQNDQSRIYEIKAIILHKMTTDIIFGMDFLLSNDSIINLNDGTICIDGKFYELDRKNDVEHEIKDLALKTKINSIIESEFDLNKKFINLIKRHKLTNPEVGRINKTCHEINVNNSMVIDLPSFRLLII
ncbi:hypothetical protein DMUE_4905 [Dictyocoela muelleri]|nr:hypothetical protein DMUE_4905 [Dictyocoela muelleri]